MTLIWILYGMIITLDVIVYGLYKKVKGMPSRQEILNLVEANSYKELPAYTEIKEKNHLRIQFEMQGELDLLSERYNSALSAFGELKTELNSRVEGIENTYRYVNINLRSLGEELERIKKVLSTKKKPIAKKKKPGRPKKKGKV